MLVAQVSRRLLNVLLELLLLVRLPGLCEVLGSGLLGQGVHNHQLGLRRKTLFKWVRLLVHLLLLLLLSILLLIHHLLLLLSCTCLFLEVLLLGLARVGSLVLWILRQLLSLVDVAHEHLAPFEVLDA